MGQCVKVGTTAELEDLEGCKLVEAGGRSIALFNIGASYYAVDNTCPHRGGLLSQGMLAEDVVISARGTARAST